MKSIVHRSLAILTIGCLASSTALAVSLSVDPAGIAGFTGSQNFASGTLSARMDYAVYAPGAYALSANAGVDPSLGTKYVYAYQIFNTGTVTPVSVSTIGQSPSSAGTSAALAENDLINLLSAGGAAASSTPILSASVKYNFEAPELAVGAFSKVLLYTSPFAPKFANGTVSDGGFTDQHPVPSPTPEPATAMTLGLMSLVLGSRLHRSNKHI